MRQSSALRDARRLIEPLRQTPVQGSASAVRVHPALLWAPFALALVGLLFQGSIAISELNRLTRDGYAPDPLTTLRPVLMQALWLVVGAGVLWGCSRIRGRFWLASAWLWLLLSWGALLWLALKLPGTVCPSPR
jgi:cell division protein FtsW (lipid II flippase)